MGNENKKMKNAPKAQTSEADKIHQSGLPVSEDLSKQNTLNKPKGDEWIVVIQSLNEREGILTNEKDTIESIKEKLLRKGFFKKSDITIDNISDKITIMIMGKSISNDTVLWKAHESYEIPEIFELNCIHAIESRFIRYR